MLSYGFPHLIQLPFLCSNGDTGGVCSSFWILVTSTTVTAKTGQQIQSHGLYRVTVTYDLNCVTIIHQFSFLYVAVNSA